MMHKTSTDLNVEALTQSSPETLQAQPVVEVLLALGSNYQAKKYLPLARERLAALGEVHLFHSLQITKTIPIQLFMQAVLPVCAPLV